MQFGAFLMPTHAPEVPIAQGQDWDLQELGRLDELGFAEAWVGEHFTAAWEPCPAPDLLLAQAFLVTKRIRLGTLGHLLPYHHPVELAHRAAYMDHLGRGRFAVGVGISALPTDHQLFAIDPSGGRNRRMTFEALRIMRLLWASDDATFAGEFWSVGEPSSHLPGLGRHLRPFQHPHPPVAIAALTPGSENHRLAGAEGYIPVSLSVSPDALVTAGHWETVACGAAGAGRAADRSQWRVIRDVYVAPTDAQARALATSGIMGRCWKEFLLPLYLGLGLGPMLKCDPSMPDEAITLDYLAEHLWLVGSPDTVARKINVLQEKTGGFGYLLAVSYDARNEHAAWIRSLKMLVEDVLPECQAVQRVPAA